MYREKFQFLKIKFQKNVQKRFFFLEFFPKIMVFIMVFKLLNGILGFSNDLLKITVCELHPGNPIELKKQNVNS